MDQINIWRILTLGKLILNVILKGDIEEKYNLPMNLLGDTL